VRVHEKKLSHARLLDVLSYDPSNGIFTHRKSWAKGRRAGHLKRTDGRRIRIEGKDYDALRLAWFYAYQSWPSGAVIPADEDRDNARIANLRVVPEFSNAELPRRRSDLTVELVRRLFFYEGGRLFWAVECSGTPIRYGMEAGNAHHSGYRVVKIGGKEYGAHQIAYAHHHGAWLIEGEIDHRDGMKDNNWPENIRKSTPAQNNASRKLSKKSNTGIRGIHKRSNGSYRVNCGPINVGTFKTLEQAFVARSVVAKEMYGEFARM
jgi:hypothetical protein